MPHYLVNDSKALLHGLRRFERRLPRGHSCAQESSDHRQGSIIHARFMMLHLTV
jgi:hypothetical protein